MDGFELPLLDNSLKSDKIIRVLFVRKGENLNMEFKKYRATRKNVELLRKALNEVGHTTYEDYSLDLPYPTKHNINSMELEHFQREFWSDMYNNEVNYKMQELEKNYKSIGERAG